MYMDWMPKLLMALDDNAVSSEAHKENRPYWLLTSGQPSLPWLSQATAGASAVNRKVGLVPPGRLTLSANWARLFITAL